MMTGVKSWKTVANYITISRIFFAVALALAEPLSLVFLALYIACGVSDIIDGYIARKTNTVSSFGEKLDSVADLIMVLILLVVLAPIVQPTFSVIIWVVIIGIIRVMSMIVVLLKFNTFSILHTYGNKATGFMLFAFPILLAFFPSELLMYIICAAATISASEELLIHLTSSKLQTNKRSIFVK
jgi:CDP-diacylglycerol--glycerol-3-phosphate 3-phosphatidyltransferase